MKKARETLEINGKKFTLAPSELNIRAYYHVEYYKYSEQMDMHKYIVHIILLDPLKINKIKPILELQRYAVGKYFEKNRNIHKYKSVFYTLVEMSKFIRFVPDISMHKMILEYKVGTQKEFKINLGQVLCIFHPTFKGELVVIPPVARVFKEGRDHVFIHSYDEAIERINSLNQLSPDFIEGL